MATVRQLKKEVDYMVCSVLLDCEAHLSRSTEHKAEVLLLVDDVFQLGSETRKKINGHKKVTGPKEKRAYFKLLIEETENAINELFARLSEIIKK
ncbi:MAG: hypothetical protein LBG30_07300 [Odoribacteraceae bacterium]|jgi:hypothetical protein|nr:hypothetical protein [Odoribacteraceae bacterium]